MPNILEDLRLKRDDNLDVKSLSPARKIYLNVLFQGIMQVTSTAIGLIIPKFILSAYGSEYNGIVASITQFLAFIGILRLGVAGATRVALYKSLTSNDSYRTSGIIKATENFMRRIAYIIIAYIVFLMIFFPWYINSSYSWLEIVTLVIAIGAGSFAEYYFGITYETLLAASQLIFVSTGIRIILSLLNALAIIILITDGYSIQTVKVATALIFAISPIFLSYYVPRLFHIIKNVEPDDSALKQRYDVMASSIANIVHENVAILTLTLLTNPLVVSVYAIYALVTNGLRQIMRVFTTGMEGYFGALWAKGDIKGVQAGLAHYEFFIMCFVSISYSCAYVLILPFIELYTDGVHDVEYVLPLYAFFALLAEMMFCIRAPYLTLVQAAGKYKETKQGSFVEAGINIVISVTGTLVWGIIGVAIGTLSANIFRTLQYARFIFKNMLPGSFRGIIYKIFWVFINIIVSIYIAKMVFIISIDSWIMFVMAGGITFLISVSVLAVSSWLLWHNEFKWMLDRFIFRKLKRR